jgi:hypothetical protein
MDCEDEWLVSNSTEIILWDGITFPTSPIIKTYICYDYNDKPGHAVFTFTPVILKSEIYCKCLSCQTEKHETFLKNQQIQKELIRKQKHQQKQQTRLDLKRKLQLIRENVFIQFITDLGKKQMVCNRRAKYVSIVTRDDSEDDREEGVWKDGESRSDYYKDEDELSSSNFSLSSVSVTESEESSVVTVVSVDEWGNMEECDDDVRREEMADIAGVYNPMRIRRDESKYNSARGIIINSKWTAEFNTIDVDCEHDEAEGVGCELPIVMRVLRAEEMSSDEDGGRSVTGLFKPSDESDTDSDINC